MILLLTPLAGVSQVSARAARQLGPLSSRLCFFASRLALLPMPVPLADRKAQTSDCLS